METLQQLFFPPSPQAMELLPYFSRDDDSLFAKFNYDDFDKDDHLEDSLTKDTSTPKELTHCDENSLPSEGLLNKQIQKVHKQNRSRTKHLIEEATQHCANMGEKRESKKPVHEYEKTRKEEEQRKKTKRVTKKNLKMKETVANSIEAMTPTSTINQVTRRTVCYEWRDWNIFFNQELASLRQDEFVTFIKIVMEKHPECVCFDNGYAELKIVAPANLSAVSENPNERMSRYGNENVMYKILSGYIEYVKKMRSDITNQIPWRR